jgi:dTMP kinase
MSAITPPAWLSKLRGRFIVFDGPDGSGKSTQFGRLIELAQQGGLTVCPVREPGGTQIGEQIRKVLLDPAHTEMDMRCELLLYMASRAQLIAQQIGPALADGKLVLADRFISSTLAYQGAAGGLAVDDILTVGKIALGKVWPDLVVVFDVDEQTAAKRMNPLLRQREFDDDYDRIENRAASYHRKVRHGYLDQAKADPDHYLLIDARGDADSVFGQLIGKLAARVKDM